MKRRMALASRSNTLRSRAHELLDALEDAGIKSMVKVSVLHPLDDVDSLFLGDPARRPSIALNEEMWLDNTEVVMARAEQEYERLTALIAEYDGPGKVRTVG